MALIAASVSTRVVSWNEAAESHESVASDAFVIPISSVGGRRLAALGDYPAVLVLEPGHSTSSPGSRSASLLQHGDPAQHCRTIISMCLSWIDTPCDR